GYFPRFNYLVDDLRASVPEAVVKGQVGRTASFEVFLNGQLLYSKLENGRFPNNGEIVDAIKKYSGEGNVKSIAINQTRTCSLL
ncbi:migration and invasion enhancer 1-like, partial [Asterias amurensis]|uniref:migration and invasion enhancer 1-like n=1 Tax=Asterias amurensis TaxID=7602 RepID=UPI003AB1C61A